MVAAKRVCSIKIGFIFWALGIVSFLGIDPAHAQTLSGKADLALIGYSDFKGGRLEEAIQSTNGPFLIKVDKKNKKKATYTDDIYPGEVYAGYGRAICKVATSKIVCNYDSGAAWSDERSVVSVTLTKIKGKKDFYKIVKIARLTYSGNPEGFYNYEYSGTVKVKVKNK